MRNIYIRTKTFLYTYIYIHRHIIIYETWNGHSFRPGASERAPHLGDQAAKSALLDWGLGRVQDLVLRVSFKAVYTG